TNTAVSTPHNNKARPRLHPNRTPDERRCRNHPIIKTVPIQKDAPITLPELGAKFWSSKTSTSAHTATSSRTPVPRFDLMLGAGARDFCIGKLADPMDSFLPIKRITQQLPEPLVSRDGLQKPVSRSSQCLRQKRVVTALRDRQHG